MANLRFRLINTGGAGVTLQCQNLDNGSSSNLLVFSPNGRVTRMSHVSRELGLSLDDNRRLRNHV